MFQNNEFMFDLNCMMSMRKTYRLYFDQDVKIRYAADFRAAEDS